AVEGTSIVAFSDSSVTRGVSTSTLSPGFTSTSMIATSLKLPMSGTRTSVRGAALMAETPSDFPRNRPLGIDAERLDRPAHRGAVHALLVGQRLERRHRDVAAIHLEEAPQRGARVRAAVAVRAESDVAPGDPLTDLIGHRAHVVGGGNHRTLAVLQQLADIGNARCLVRMQQVPALALE